MSKESRSSLEDSILESMDSDDQALLPYLPYILQDIWTLGTDPPAIITLIQENYDQTKDISILDLGCGKGAVSIQLADTLGCHCHGIDGVASFIEDAHDYAIRFAVDTLCSFEVGDIRKKILQLPSYDIIILGAIGPVFGNYTDTLRKIKSHLNPGGAVIIDDAYYADGLAPDAEYQRRSDILSQINSAEMVIVDEHILPNEVIQQANRKMYQQIESRSTELIKRHPQKKVLFEKYLKAQQVENEILESHVINTIFLLQEKIG